MNSKKHLSKKAAADLAQAPAAVAMPSTGWNFHERTDRNDGVVTAWIDGSNWSHKTRANFDRAIDQLRQQPERSWSTPNPASKIGNHTYVIRFKDVSSMQLRLFGHFFREHGSFVMTMQGYEKDDVYHPKNYESLAETHRIGCNKDFHDTTQPFEEYCAICTACNDGCS